MISVRITQNNLNLSFPTSIITTNNTGADEAKKSSKTPNELTKEIVQQEISKIQESKTNTGQDNPKAKSILTKFHSGKKLTKEEMEYIRRHAPAMVEHVERVSQEREVVEQSMRMAPSKSDVQMVALSAANHIRKQAKGDDAITRANHLADAKHEYEKADEYKEKPNTLFERDVHKHRKYKQTKKSTYTYVAATNLYDKFTHSWKREELSIKKK